MLNVEKIRLMTQLSIYERREGEGIIETSKFFKGDYVSRKILTSCIYYTLCFILIAIVLSIINLEEILLKLNIPFIMDSLRSIVIVYLVGMVFMILGSYIRFTARYDYVHRKSLFYSAKLDKLLHMQENEDSLDITEEESEYYKETGGKIRIYDDSRNTWETVKPQFHTVVRRGPVTNIPDTDDLKFMPIGKNISKRPASKQDNASNTSFGNKNSGRAAGPDKHYIPKGGWLDEEKGSKVITKKTSAAISPPEGGWLDEDLDDEDAGLDILSVHKKDK